MRFKRGILLLALTSAIFPTGCVLSEDGPNALVHNQTVQALTITYVRRPAARQEPVLWAPLEPRHFNTIISPFRWEGSNLVEGCLPGTLIAIAADGHEVARITGLCDGDRWDITE